MDSIWSQKENNTLFTPSSVPSSHQKMPIKDVLYVSTFESNLLPVNKFTKQTMFFQR